MNWQVKIPTGKWMTGIHTFKTKRAAVKFIDEWNEACSKDEFIFLNLYRGRHTKDNRNLADY